VSCVITLAALLAAPNPPAVAGPRVCIEPSTPIQVIEEGPTSTAPFCIDSPDDPRCWLTPQPAVPAPRVSASSWEIRQAGSSAALTPIWVVGELLWHYAGHERSGFPRALERPPRPSL